MTADYVHMYFSRKTSNSARRQKLHASFKNESGIVKSFFLRFPKFRRQRKISTNLQDNLLLVKAPGNDVRKETLVWKMINYESNKSHNSRSKSQRIRDKENTDTGCHGNCAKNCKQKFQNFLRKFIR